MSQNSERPGCWPTYLCLKKASAPCSSPASGGPAAPLGRRALAVHFRAASPCLRLFGLASLCRAHRKKSSLRSKHRKTLPVFAVGGWCLDAVPVPVPACGLCMPKKNERPSGSPTYLCRKKTSAFGLLALSPEKNASQPVTGSYWTDSFSGTAAAAVRSGSGRSCAHRAGGAIDSAKRKAFVLFISTDWRSAPALLQAITAASKQCPAREAFARSSSRCWRPKRVPSCHPGAAAWAHSTPCASTAATRNGK